MLIVLKPRTALIVLKVGDSIKELKLGWFDAYLGGAAVDEVPR